MEQYILTIISNRGEEIPNTEKIEKEIQVIAKQELKLYDSEIYLKKIT